MLVLKLNLAERIIIGSPDVQVALVSTNSVSARIGVVAPPTMPVHREVIWAKAMANAKAVPPSAPVMHALEQLLPWALLGLAESHPAVMLCRQLGITAGPVANAEEVAEALAAARSAR